MSDSQLSASELRAKYSAGGVDDSQLSASQLRARHGIQHNTKDFSTKDNSTLSGLCASLFSLPLFSYSDLSLLQVFVAIGFAVFTIIGYFVFGHKFIETGNNEHDDL